MAPWPEATNLILPNPLEVSRSARHQKPHRRSSYSLTMCESMPNRANLLDHLPKQEHTWRRSEISNMNLLSSFRFNLSPSFHSSLPNLRTHLCYQGKFAYMQYAKWQEASDPRPAASIPFPYSQRKHSIIRQTELGLVGLVHAIQ